MAAGFPTAYALEVEFTPAVWTDISAYADFDTGVDLHYGRTDAGEPVAPGSLDATLRDPDGRFVPDNPLSPYYPNVVEGKRIRLRVTKGVIRTRFLGYIQSWAPSLPPGGAIADGVCVVSAVTEDGAKRRPLRGLYEGHAAISADAFFVPGAGDGLPGPGMLSNIISGSAVTARRVEPLVSSDGGTVTVAAPDRLFVESVLRFEPGVARKGPVYQVDASSLTGNDEIAFVCRTDEEATPASTDALISAYSANGNPVVWQIRYIQGLTGITGLWYTLGGDTLLLEQAATGQWVRVRIRATEILVETESGYSATIAGTYPLAEPLLVIGGLPGAVHAAGKQSDCPRFEFGCLAFGIASGGAYLGPTWPGAQTTVATLANTIPDDITVTVVGAQDQQAGYPDIRGLTASGAHQVNAATNGSTWWVTPAGVPTLRLPDVVRTAAPVLTFDLEGDGDGTLEASRARESIPTRSTVTFPGGETTVINTTAEADGSSRQVDITTAALNASDAAHPAEQVLAVGPTLRINRIGIDLAGAVTDLYAAAADVYPGARIRVNGLLSSWFGYTTADLIVQGWTERYALGGVTMVFDCTQADSPHEGIVDTDRVGATDSTLAATITSSATALSVTIGASGETWTTAAGDYPMTARIDGEIVSLPSAPASGSAPSWTGVTRGVSGTIAAAHTAGAEVQPHFVATVAIG